MGTPADVGASGRQRLDGYIRVSAVAERAGESFQSPGRQREAIARWAAVSGVKIAAWHRDLDRSGGHLDRPGLFALLERIRSGSTDGVVVDSLDRLSRARVGDALHLCDEIREAGGRVVALDLVGAETVDPFGEFALTMMLALARLQWHRYAEHWALCREAAIGRGVHRYAVPYGYRRDTAGRLVVEPQEARIVREVFRRRRAGESSPAIRRWLDQAAPRDGGLVWAPNSARKMVANTAYLGLVRDGRFINECAHEPVVDPDLWLSAQSPAGERPQRNPEVLLSGLVRCASCGHLMSGRRGPRRAHLYMCGRHFASGRCPAPVAITADRLEGEVARQLFDHLARLKLDRSGLEARRKRAEASVRRAERAVAHLLAQNPEDPRATQQELRRHEQVLQRAEVRRARLVQETSDPPPDPDRLRGDWPTLPAPEKHALFAARLDAVLVRRATQHWTHAPAAERIRVLFTGEAPPGPRGIARTTQRWQWDGRPGVRPVV